MPVSKAKTKASENVESESTSTASVDQPKMVDATSDIVSEVIDATPPISENIEQLASQYEREHEGEGDTQPEGESQPLNVGSIPLITPDPDRVFDPSIHCVDKVGNPIKCMDGSYRRKRGKGQAKPEGIQNGFPQPVVANVNMAKQAAITTVETILMMGLILGGEEWKPVKEDGRDERASLIAAWETYYLATGQVTVPPWCIVLVATSSYALPRLAMPKTQEKIGAFVEKIKGKWGK